MSLRVSVIAALASEPQHRLDRLVRHAEHQSCAGESELIIAVPPDEVERVRPLVGSASMRVTVVENPSGARSSGLNLAAEAAQGPYLARFDARSSPPPSYVERCLARLEACPWIGVTGGVQLPTVPTGGGAVPRGVARALANAWAMGGASYRRGRWGIADTVYLGVFRREELLNLKFDERLAANEDFDLCQRYHDAGLGVWIEEGLYVPYEPRSSPQEVWRQYFAFGRSKVRYWRLRRTGPNSRQQVALALAALGCIVAVVSLVKKPSLLFSSVCGAGVVMVLVDELGSGAKATLGERAIAVTTLAAAWVGWLSGIVVEAVPRRLV
jgi:hypothetical protein